MKICEVLGSPVPYTWHSLPRPGGDEARFQVNDVGYKVDFMNGTWGGQNNPITTLQYSIDFQSMQKLGRTDLTGPTNLGVQFPVMSTVMATIHDWFGSHKPDRLFFWDADRKRSRARFYQRVAEMLSKYGYEPDPDLENVRRRMGNPSIWLLRQAAPSSV